MPRGKNRWGNGNGDSGPSLASIGLSIHGGDLFLPIADAAPISLPDLTISSDASFTRDLTIPAIDAGPAFHTSNASVRLALSDGVLSFTLRSPVSVSVLAGSLNVTLDSFAVASDGTFDGSVTGRLKLAGFRMTTAATLDVSAQNGVVKLTLPATDPVGINLGFETTTFSGFVKSDQTYSFTGTASEGFGVLGFSVSGTATFHLRDSGYAASFSGRACAPVVGCTGASGTISSTGLIQGTIGSPPHDVAFTFQL